MLMSNRRKERELSSRRKGRELALMALYALDGVPSFEQFQALDRFWIFFEEAQTWHALFASSSHEDQDHPLSAPPLWELFDHLPLLPPAVRDEPPFSKAQAAKKFALKRIEGIIEEGPLIDKTITGASRGWRIERMARVDRNILRLGTYEILFCPDVPPAVVIDEAIELSKLYSSAKSRSFINGVLDRIRRDQAPKKEKD